MEEYREHLLLEAIISASNIAVGLTSVRRYDFSDRGPFFTGLFTYTIGVERILKLIVILDYYLAHKAPPDDAHLRGLGHDLCRLVAKAKEINVSRDFEVDSSKIDDALVTAVIDFLARFAKRTRYYNLDVVTGATTSAQEPLSEWNQRVAQVIIQRHHRVTRRQRQEIAFGRLLANAPGIIVHHTADDGSPISDLGELATHNVLIETKQKYSVYYLHQVVEFCISVLEKLDYAFSPALYISEPFRTMSCVPRKAVLRRKIWRPYL